MAVLGKRSSMKKKMNGRTIWNGILCALALCVAAIPAAADEIRLKDGKKLYGVIVAYEDNMFKIKTDYGYVLVEKDKIASIVPTTSAAAPPAKPEPKPAVKKEPAKEAVKPPTESVKAGGAAEAQPKAEPAMVSSTEATPAPANASAKTVTPSGGAAGKTKKSESKKSEPAQVAGVTATTAPPAAVPAATPAPTNVASKEKKETAAAKSSSAAIANATPQKPAPIPVAAPAPPKEPEIPANREEIQGNYYTNYTHGFRMYKAPSWSLIEDARKALPNAIVAMGTSNESTLMVVGEEKAKEPLDTAAAAVEKRLHDVYDNYKIISQRKTTVGGLSAVEYHYHGMADDHAWSGTLVVVARGNVILTVLGMTYADTDLIQIQENVIARSIASFDFNAH
jgi:hypothetical protein